MLGYKLKQMPVRIIHLGKLRETTTTTKNGSNLVLAIDAGSCHKSVAALSWNKKMLAVAVASQQRPPAMKTRPFSSIRRPHNFHLFLFQFSFLIF